MLLGSLLTLSLFCMLSGALFAAGSRLYGEDVATSTGSVYLLERWGPPPEGCWPGWCWYDTSPRSRSHWG